MRLINLVIRLLIQVVALMRAHKDGTVVDRRSGGTSTGAQPPEIMIHAEAQFPDALVSEYRVAQIAQGKRDRFVLIINVVSVLVIVAYTIVSFFQLREVHDQTTAAATNLRPWIRIREIRLAHANETSNNRDGLRFQFDGKMPIAATLNYKLSYENVGHVVAEDLRVNPSLIFDNDFDKFTSRAMIEENGACRAEDEMTNGDNFGIIVFPAEVKADVVELSAAIRTTSPSVYGGLVLCISYRDASGKRYHTKAVAYLFGKRNALLRLGVNLDGSAFQMIRNSYADRAE